MSAGGQLKNKASKARFNSKHGVLRGPKETPKKKPSYNSGKRDVLKKLSK